MKTFDFVTHPLTVLAILLLVVLGGLAYLDAHWCGIAALTVQQGC